MKMRFASFGQVFAGKPTERQQSGLRQAFGLADLEKDWDRTSDRFYRRRPPLGAFVCPNHSASEYAQFRDDPAARRVVPAARRDIGAMVSGAARLAACPKPKRKTKHNKFNHRRFL